MNATFHRFAAIPALLFATLSAASAADRVALVIGVNRYEHLAANAQLRVAVSDAELMAESLESLDPPFSVTLLTDVSQDEAEETYEIFLKQAAEAECALVYFAGHGIEYNGSNYLLVKDTAISEISADVELMKRRLGREALSLQAMVDSLDLTGAAVKLVVLDCCRDNPLVAETPTGNRSVVGGRSGLAQVAAPSGTLISYSADAGQKANDGLFTAVLAKNLKVPGLTAVQVFATTREEVRETSTEWAAEDQKKGLDPDFRRVRHEPAEYTKLNLAGTNFTFSRGVPAKVVATEDTPPAPDAGSMADKARIAELEKRLAEVEAMKKAEPVPSVPSTPISMVKTDPAPAPAFPATRGGIVSGRPFRSAVATDYVWVEPGEFTMGSSAAEQAALCTPEAGGKAELYKDETAHSVTISQGYWVGAHEVTIRDYLRFLNAVGKCDAEWVDFENELSPLVKSGSSFSMKAGEGATWGDEALPMVYVSWHGAAAYCEWLSGEEKSRLPAGYRFGLPTEAEWEMAARAGTKTMTYAGDLKILGLNNAPLLDGIAWYGGNSGLAHGSGYDLYFLKNKQNTNQSAGTHSVGLKLPNEIGAYDMIGNVFEWCSDYYGEDYYEDGQDNPTGPSEGTFRVFRGGSWSNDAQVCRAANRSGVTPGLRFRFLGFRPALSSLQAR